MEENNESKKYFIKDAELISIDQDKLNYKDVAKNIELIMDSSEPPLNIALTGKSGAGKSSIINFLCSKYRSNPEEYNVEEINVWKEKVSIKEYLESKFTKINRNIEIDNNQSEGNENGSVLEANNDYTEGEFIDETKGKKDKKVLSKSSRMLLAICNVILTFVACFFATSIIFVIMEYFQNIDIYRRNDIFFVENTYLNYSDNLGLIMLFSLLLSGIIIIVNKLYIKKDKKDVKSTLINENDSLNLQDDNEKEIDVDMSDSGLKNIVIIEDIDKLSVGKILKVLEEIRYCNEYENCFFIVPLEKNILKKAIEIRNVVKASAKFKPLKFEKIFDKIFQFKVSIPQIPSSSLKNYAVNLVQEDIPDFIDEYCQIEIFEGVIRNILIHKNVTTPRHVKKLINNFVNNKLLAVSKYENGDIDENFIKADGFDFQLAKISVLQSDFEEFYDLIFKDFSYLDKLTELYGLTNEEFKAKYEEIDEELKPFFKAKYKPLRNFLRQTKNYIVDDIVTLMYLTKNTSERLFKSRPISSYISGEVNLSDWSNQQVLELIKLINDKNDLSEFAANNFEQLLENYQKNAADEVYFSEFNNNIYEIEEYIDKEDYLKYLKMVADNYESYPEEALQVFKYTKVPITGDIMGFLLGKLEKNLSVENYQDVYEVVRDNSDCFYEENGNISEYVRFLVEHINLSHNPDEVITELDDNFTRIGKVYELNKNIKGMENIDYDKAYTFMAKCLDNGDLERMKYVINSILSEADSIKDCLKIEERMKKYNLVDVIECNVDDLIDAETDKLGMAEEETVEKVELQGENSIENNYILLRNLLELCAIKQIYLNANDVMKIVEKALANNENEEYVLSVYEVLYKLDRMYFYEIRRDFNEIIYSSFHSAKKDNVKKVALDCTRYFKNTRLFKTKLTKDEEQFYSAN